MSCSSALPHRLPMCRHCSGRGAAKGPRAVPVLGGMTVQVGTLVLCSYGNVEGKQGMVGDLME